MRVPFPSTVVVLATLAGCGEGARAPGGVPVAGPLPVFTVDEPDLTIGVVEGDEDYLFQSIRSVLRLPDGRVAVADAGGARIALYSPEGVFLQAFGGEGGGPGEFGALMRIYLHGRDSLLAFDGRRDRVSVFSLDGGFGRQADAVELSGDSTYRADVWPHRRFLVEGALRPGARRAARAALDGLPDPYGASVARLAWWTGEGELWVRETRMEGGSDSWLVVDGEGNPVRWVDLPAGFRPLQREGSRVWGRTVGELDVEFVHGYALVPTEARRALPAWVSSPVPVPDSLAVDGDELRARVQSSLRHLASAQEIHYATNYSYSPDLAALEVPEDALPDGLEVQILSAGTRGWSILAAHPDAREICTLGYGLDVPPGWLGGMVSCGG